MKNSPYIKVLCVSVGSALLLSLFSLFCMTKVSEYSAQERRKDFMLFIAEIVEREPINQDSLLFFNKRPSPPDRARREKFSSRRPPLGLPPGPPPGDLSVVLHFGFSMKKDEFFHEMPPYHYP